MKKRILFVCLIAALLLAAAPVCAGAAGAMRFVVQSTSRRMQVGGELTVPVKVSSNPGYVLGSVLLSWDESALELTDVSYSTLAPRAHSGEISNTGSYVIDFGDESALADFTGTGTFFTLTFKISASARAGDYTVRLSDTEAGIVNNELETVTASFSAGTVTLTAPSEAGSGFSDVLSGQWYCEAIDYVVDEGLMKGVTATSFQPGGSLSRAMLATMLYRLEGSPAVGGRNPFSDVAAGQWYAPAVVWANAQGVVTGYSDGRFGPGDDITREQIAAMLLRYARYKGCDTSRRADLSRYTDRSSLSSWAAEPMSWAVAEGLVTGRSAATLAPGAGATRAEAAAILMRFCRYSAN